MREFIRELGKRVSVLSAIESERPKTRVVAFVAVRLSEFVPDYIPAFE